jgi:hypothetical protein
MNLGPFLTLILSSRDTEFEDEGLREVGSDTTTQSSLAIPSEKDAAEAKADQPAIVNLGRMISRIRSPRRRCACWSGLTLLTMLCRHRPRRACSRWQGPTLPRGCVMLVRYSSR